MERDTRPVAEILRELFFTFLECDEPEHAAVFDAAKDPARYAERRAALRRFVADQVFLTDFTAFDAEVAAEQADNFLGVLERKVDGRFFIAWCAREAEAAAPDLLKA
jgi:hypothetical protein